MSLAVFHVRSVSKQVRVRARRIGVNAINPLVRTTQIKVSYRELGISEFVAHLKPKLDPVLSDSTATVVDAAVTRERNPLLVLTCSSHKLIVAVPTALTRILLPRSSRNLLSETASINSFPRIAP
jgi:hypothetical protein